MSDYLNKETLIIGCGNILFGDDGFGYAVINELKNMTQRTSDSTSNLDLNFDNVEIIDAGTSASYFILSLIDETTPIKKIIIVDAIDYGLEAGELKKLYPKDLPKIGKYNMDTHNVPLASILVELNKKYGIDVVVVGCQVGDISAPEICVELTNEVKKAVKKAVDIVIDELSDFE
jgi:coenzyme F420 hydrogenase subunit delta